MAETEQPVGGVGGMSPKTTMEIMVAVVIVFFLLFVFGLFLYLRAKKCWGANPAFGRRSARFVFTMEPAIVPPLGLDPAAINALPSFVFRAVEFKEGMECAVCLSEVTEGEMARLLPRCSHGFHLECIGMWLNSHSTCPLCRTPVISDSLRKAAHSSAEVVPIPIPQTEATSRDRNSVEPPSHLPANVPFWESQEQVSTVSSTSQEGSSSSSSGFFAGKPEEMLVVEIPKRVFDGLPSSNSPLRLSRLPVEEEFRLPAPAGLRSLRKLLTGLSSPCSTPRELDIEQGGLPVSKL